MEKFFLRTGVVLIEIQGDLALFFHYGNRHLVQGAFVPKVLGDLCILLRSPRTEEQLVGDLKAKASPEEVRTALQALRASRFIGTAAESEDQAEIERADRRLLNFFGHFMGQKFDGESQEARQALRRVRSARVAVVNLGFFGPALIDRLIDLGPAGIEVFDDETVNELDLENYPRIFGTQDLGRPRREILARHYAASSVGFEPFSASKLRSADIVLGAGTWYDLRRYLELDRACRSLGRKWLAVIQDYFGGTVGPCFGIAGGPCFNCLIRRRDANLLHIDKQRAVESFFEKNRRETGLNFPFFSDMLANAAVLEMTKAITEVMFPRTYRGLYEFDFLNHREEYSELLASPFCEVCSPLEAAPKEAFFTPR